MTTTEPPTIASTRNRYREIAPVPDRDAEDLGEQFGRFLAMVGQRRAFLGAFSADDAEAAGVAMAAVLLWHRLESYAEPHLSERAAKDIVKAWADSEAVTEWLNKFVRRYGIDPDEVTTVAATEHALMFAKQQDAEQAAVEMAQALRLAREAVEAVHRLADSHARVMYAASVDLSRADPDSARQLLWEQLDGFDGERALDDETGPQYLRRTRPKPVPKPRSGEPEPSRM